MECPFCDEGVIERQRIYETHREYVLHNIRPAARGQCLVVPKKHVLTLHDLSERELASIMVTVGQAAAVLKEYLNPIGMNYGANEGEWAGQSVEHFHFHILPRFRDDCIQEYHLFHRDPQTKRNLSLDELEPRVKELRKLFRLS